MIAMLMASLLFAAKITLPSIFLLLFGLFLRRMSQIDGHFCMQATQFMFRWALPALLFVAIVTSDIHFAEHLDLIVAGVVVTLLLFTAALVVALRYFREPANRGVFVQGIYRGNTAIIGLAFCANAYGNQGLALGALFTSVMTVLFNILAVIALSTGHTQQRVSWGVILQRILQNPLIIGIVLGFIVHFSALPLPTTLMTAAKHLGATALPLALICIGATFDVRSMLHVKDLALPTALTRLILSPLLAAWVGILFHLEPVAMGVLFLMCSTPVAAAAYVMSKAMGGNEVLMANIIGLTTFLSMFSASLGAVLMHSAGLM